MPLEISNDDPLNEVNSPQTNTYSHEYDADNPIPYSVGKDFENVSSRGVHYGSSGLRMLNLCEQWLHEYKPWHRDSAKVAKFYSGSVTETQKQRKVLGLIDHANYMPGRTALVTARDEAFNYFTQPRRLGNITLKNYEGTPGQKAAQEAKASAIIDRFLRKKCPTFLRECEDMCDRHSVHGDAVMIFPPEEDGFLPFEAEILTDTDAPQNIHDDNFRRWAVMGDLQVSQVLQAVREDRPGWTKGIKKALEFFWKTERESIDPDYDEGYNPHELVEMVSCMTPEEYESAAQGSGEICDFINSRLRVFFFFQKDFSDPSMGVPVDYYVVARFRKEASSYLDEDDAIPDAMLFKKKAAYKSVKRCAVDFVLDTNIGVKDRNWGSIKGLGHLNFLPDSMMNILISAMQNSAIDKNTPLWQIGDIGDQKLFENWIKKGYKAHSILPTGLDLVDKTKFGSNVGEAVSLIQFFQRLSNEQSISQTRDSTPQAPDELRVQTIQRSNRDQRLFSNRGVGFSYKMEYFVAELYRRILNEIHNYSYIAGARSNVASLHADLLGACVEVEWFYPENVEVTYPKLLGDGDPEARRLANAEIIQNLALIPEEQRQDEIMEWYAIRVGWDKAEQVFDTKNNEKANSEQVSMALTKFSSMIQLVQPYPVSQNDVPEIQVPAMLGAAKKMIDLVLATGEFSLREAQGFTAAGAHILLLIDKLRELGRRDVAEVFEAELQKLSAAIEEPIQNLLTSKQEGLSEGDQVELQKLQLQADKQRLEEARFQHKVTRDASTDQRNQRKQDLNEFNSAKRNIREQERNEIYRLQTEFQALQQRLRG